MLLHAILAGIAFGLYYALVGLGLNLVFGVMRVVNLAHGDFMVLGAYAAYWAYSLAGLHPLPAAVGVALALAALGLPLYYVLVPRLLAARDPEMLSFILFFGLQQVMEAAMAIGWGTTARSIPGRVLGRHPVWFFTERLPAPWVYTGAVSLACVVLVYLYLYQTGAGRLTRAVMADREEALVSGIDVHAVCALAFGIGLALAGVAGVFAPFMLGSVTPATGGEIILAAFAVIVIGSLGNPLGTMLGGLIYGIALMIMQTYLSAWANLLPNLLLIFVLLVRPAGLLGRRVRHA